MKWEKKNSHNDYPNLVIKNIEKAQPPQSQKRPSNRLFSGALTPASSSHPRVRRRALAYKCRMHRFRAAHTRARAKCIASHRRATFALPPPSPSDSPIAEQGRAAEGERESHTRARKNCTHASGGETASRQVGCTAHVYIYEHVCTYRYLCLYVRTAKERGKIAGQSLTGRFDALAWGCERGNALLCGVELGNEWRIF